MKATYHITEDDYVAGLLLGTALRFRSLFRLFAVYCIGVFLYLWLNQDTLVSTGTMVAGITLVVVLYFFILRRFVAASSFRKHYRKYKLIQDPISVELSDSGVEQASEHYTTRLAWDYILGWRENDAYFLLAIAPRLYHIVPKRIAADGFDFDTLRERLADAGKIRDVKPHCAAEATTSP